MKRLALLTCLFFARGMPQARAVEFGKAQVAGKQVTFCRVNVRKERLQLFLRDSAGEPIKRFTALVTQLRQRNQELSFAMNAGMFHPGLAPVGLCVAEGQTLAPLNTAAGEGNFFLKPNGVFYVTKSGASVSDSSDFARLDETPILATQSGPLLVKAGKIHPAFRQESTSRLFRNGVGIPSAETAVFAISDEPVNFYEFAVFFRDVIHCPDALFFDGSVSSLYAPTLQRSDFRMDLGPMIGVTVPATSR